MRDAEHRARMNGKVKGIHLRGKASRTWEKVFGNPVIVDPRLPEGTIVIVPHRPEPATNSHKSPRRRLPCGQECSCSGRLDWCIGDVVDEQGLDAFLADRD